MQNLRSFLVLYAWPSFQFINSFIYGTDILPPIMQSGLPYSMTKTKGYFWKKTLITTITTAITITVIIITIWRRKGEEWKTWAKKKSGQNLKANSQSTAKLEKPEWTPVSWENHPYFLLWAPPALGHCWTPLFSICSPTAEQHHLPAPHWKYGLRAKASKGNMQISLHFHTQSLKLAFHPLHSKS